MTFDSWDDVMFWHGSLIGYMAGVKSACKDEDKSHLLLRMADTQARLEFMESENAKLREQYETVLADYRSEVAKLRKLVKHLYEYRQTYFKTGIYPTDHGVTEQRMRELGIEVDG